MKTTTEREIEELLSSERNGIAHVRGIARKHNADLPEWCNRQRRRDGIRRCVMAVCVITAIGVLILRQPHNPHSPQDRILANQQSDFPNAANNSPSSQTRQNELESHSGLREYAQHRKAIKTAISSNDVDHQSDILTFEADSVLLMAHATLQDDKWDIVDEQNSMVDDGAIRLVCNATVCSVEKYSMIFYEALSCNAI